jgi:hypothetical protein
MNRVLIIALVIGTLISAACGASPSPSSVDDEGKLVSVDGGAYTDITVPELETMLENKDFTFVNVHIPFEGDIPISRSPLIRSTRIWINFLLVKMTKSCFIAAVGV